jgi:hypothetical protein
VAPDDVNVLYAAGSVFEQLGHRQRALALIRESVRRGYARDEVERAPGLAGLRADPRWKTDRGRVEDVKEGG